MSAPESNQRTVQRKRHADERRSWTGVPLAAKLIVLLCVALLLVIPLARRRGSRSDTAVAVGNEEVKGKSSSTTATTGSAFTPDLEIAEARLDRATRTVVGTVRNKSNRVYTNIEVSYFSRDARGEDAGTVRGTIPRLDPHGTAPFHTAAFAPSGVTWDLGEVSGDPQ
jgi:hypothetical protein